ncbi:MAG: VCBS repeat-containing protein [Bacteroidota bacterium]|nr:VCBS repeat-containing protein [Bacteroidota bacterium]MDP4246777.1 VCBS repeat-containing protein [Bacteroidota bacterium]MDP4260503.1 VCBS repeat-containing protein [Bacteroidota bacterium]
MRYLPFIGIRTCLICLPIVLAFSCSQKRESQEEQPLFQKVLSSQSGITFNNLVEENAYRNNFDNFAYVYNGGGVAIGDINNDGLEDIYFTGNEVPNKLYLNLGGMKFKDITESAGVDGGKGWDNGATMVDINHDGWMDIYVCKGGFGDSDDERRNLLYVNQKDGTFKEEAKEYGLDDDGYTMQAVFFDMDNDNDLDCYLIARPDSFYLGLPRMVSGKRNPPEKCRNKLYRNDNGHFVEVGKEAGIGQTFGYGLSGSNADLNGDGYDDMYVANDYADNDYMFINQRNGRFKDEIKKATNHVSLFSMGSDIADINNDGLEDILVMEMLPENYKRSKISMPRMDVSGFWAIVDSGFEKQYMHNVLHLNQGNGFFSDISQLAGISKTDWSWAALACDFDNDGKRDIYVANGYRRNTFDGDILQKQDAYIKANMSRYKSADEMFEKGFKDFVNIYDPLKARNYLFRNQGDLRFENVSQAWGITDSTFSNGAAVADLDNDGDLDLVVNNLDGEAIVYENKTGNRNNYIRLKLDGPEQNRDGIGAKISLYYEGRMQQFFEQKVVRGYLSSSDPIVHFGLGKTPRVDSVVVRWLDGKENVLRNVDANQVVRVNYRESTSGVDRSRKYQPAFAEAGGLLSKPFVHKENKVDEYKDQVLLPHMFSRSGPWIATGDVNGDGLEDFYIGGASGQAGRLYVQTADGHFEPKPEPAFEADKAFEDMGTVLFDADHDGDLDLYVVSGGSEFPDGSPMYQDRLYLNDGKGNFTRAPLPKTESSGSCVVVCDIDGDGYPDLFRGGQVMPHGYPRSPRSYVLMNKKGKFVDATSELAPSLVHAGMVNSAIWADLDGDKKPELVVTGEWMPIRVFQNEGGKLVEETRKFGLEGTEGWWNTLYAVDVDGDGDLDIVAGNLGENYKFKASAETPFEVYAKDFDHNGTNDIFLAKYADGLQVPVRGRECTSQQCPFIAKKFPSFLSFAESDLKTLLGDEIETAVHLKAHLFSSVILLNDHGKFTIKKLPVEAQLSTVNGILAADFDRDGINDLLISGNKFDVEVETTPADASPGLFLKGLGNLNYQSTKPLESGFFVPYNVKDMKAIKVKDRWAVLVSSNNDSLRVFTTLK